jgi:hypothetical protein
MLLSLKNAGIYRSNTLQLNALQKTLTYLVTLARREVSEMDACSYHSKMLGFVDQTGG